MFAGPKGTVTSIITVIIITVQGQIFLPKNYETTNKLLWTQNMISNCFSYTNLKQNFEFIDGRKFDGLRTSDKKSLKLLKL